MFYYNLAIGRSNEATIAISLFQNINQIVFYEKILQIGVDSIVANAGPKNRAIHLLEYRLKRPWLAMADLHLTLKRTATEASMQKYNGTYGKCN